VILRSNGPLTANEQLLDLTILHAIYLERLKAGEVKRIVGLLNDDVIPDLLDKAHRALERIRLRGIDGAALGTQRYRDLIAALDEIAKAGMAVLRQDNAASLFDIARHESEWQTRALRAATPAGIHFEFQLPNANLLRSIVTSRPMRGHLLKDWWSELAVSTRRKATAQINMGIAEGEDVDAIVRRLRGTRESRYTDGILQQTRHSVQSIVRTSVSHVTAHATQETLNANSDIVKGQQLVATLDLRTCFAAGTPVHLANGNTRSIEDVQPGDLVISGCGATRRVSAVQRKRSTDWRTLRTDDGTVVRCTATHPFWADVGGGRFEWVEARDLVPGALLAHGDVLALRGPLQEEGLATAELLLARVLPRGDEEDLGRSGVHAVLPAVPCAEDLRSAGRERRAPLLAGLLPDLQCGDSAGAHGAGGARARGIALRAGSEGRTLVRGLPCDGLATSEEPAHDVVPRPAGAVRIVSISADHDPADCFDIEVAGDHCYLVGAARLIAHNTSICRARDGKVYKIGSAPTLPFHWGERSRYVPVLKSFSELGIPLKDLPPSTRASMDGQVPETLTYYQWLAQQSADRQDEALGPARAALFRRGTLDPSKFVDAFGRALTLRELEALEARAA
jgi:hypothetical protein